MNEIQDFIQSIPELSSIRKEFYVHMLTLRKKLLLEYVYDRLPKQESISPSSHLAEDIHQRETFSHPFAAGTCEERYQRLMKELLQDYIHPKKHIRDSRIDAHVTAILLNENQYTKEAIQAAIQAVSPNALLYPDYPQKIFLLAKEKRNRAFARDYRTKDKGHNLRQ